MVKRILKFILVFSFGFFVYQQPVVSATLPSDSDFDGDGLSNATELSLKTDPYNADSDKDGYDDNSEIKNGFNPLVGNGDRNVKRHVEINLSKQQLVYFMNGVKVASAFVSTGLRKTPTPTGTFEIMRKVPVIRYKGIDYDFPGTKWNLEFKKSYYIHGAYWHNQFGIKPMSHGCVNVAYKDMQQIYTFLDKGDKVKIYGTIPKSPLVRK